MTALWGVAAADPQAIPVDSELVAAARGGDKAAFVQLVSRHRTAALVLTARMLTDHDLASDAVQEATVVAMVSLDRLRVPERFGPWLCGIALNVARRWLRGTRALVPIVEDLGSSTGPTPEEAAEASEMAALVRQAVDGLPPGQRQAVLLFYWLGLTHAEAAAELGISVGAVKARLHQARAGLEPHLSIVVHNEKERVMSTVTESNWVEMSVAEVRRAPGDDPTRRPHVVLLRDRAGTRTLPIWTGAPEAIALAVNLEAVEMPRPMTYQLAHRLVAAGGGHIAEVRITSLAESTYYAVVVVAGPGGTTEVDARPSDGLNMALVAGAPILVDAAILDDPKAVGHTAWQDYPTTTTDLVDEVRERQAETVRFLEALAQEGDPPPAT